MTMTMVITIIAAVIFGVFCFLCIYFLFHNRIETKNNEKRMQMLEQKMGLMGELINNKTDMLAEKMTEHGQILEAVRLAEEEKARREEPKPEPETETETEEISLEDIFGKDFSDIEFEDVLVEETENTSEPVSPWAAPIDKNEPEVPVQPAAPVPQAAAATPVVEAAPVTPVVQAAPVTPVMQTIPAEPVMEAVPAAPIMQEAPVAPAMETVPEEQIIMPQQNAEEERFEIGKSGKKYTLSELENLIRE